MIKWPWRKLSFRKRFESEMDEELRLHLEMQTEANIRSGMSADEARYAALRQFGNVENIKETARDQRGWTWLENRAKDVRYALRGLKASPTFTFVAVFCLALGIGGNAVTFSLLDAVLLRQLPVSNPADLRLIFWSADHAELSNYSGSGGRATAKGGRVSASFPFATYRDFQALAPGFSDMLAFSPLSGQTFLARHEAVKVDGLIVTGNFFSAYGGRAIVGRPLLAEDDRPEGSPVVVITHRFWRRMFAEDTGVIGEQVVINRTSFTLVGVLAPDYVGPTLGDSPDFYVPMAAQPSLLPSRMLDSYNNWWVEIIGRLSPDTDEAAVTRSLEAIFERTLSAPGGKTKMTNPHILLEDGSRGPLLIRERVADPVYILMGALTLVLLVACTNLASLMLARGISRRHEYSIRMALGAGRGRLVVQAVVESLLISVSAAILGLAFAALTQRVLISFFAYNFDQFHLDVRTDIRVVAFTLVISLLTALLFGLIPALRATRVHPLDGLKSRNDAAVPSLRLARLLVVGQVTLSLLLLVGAGLSLRTLLNLARIQTGFNPENLLMFEVDPGQATGYDEKKRCVLYEELSQSLAALPGVTSVAFSTLPLVGGGYWGSGIKIPGRPAEPVDVGQFEVSDRFFTAMGIPILRGRELDARDGPNGVPAAVVNNRFASRFFPGEDPLEKIVWVGSKSFRIVGVCGDTRIQDIRKEVRPVMFYPFRQSSPSSVVFALRSLVPPTSLVPSVRTAVATRDPLLPVTGVITQAERIDRLLSLERVFAVLCVSAGSLALLLACVGLYGLVAYNVARRTGEIGIRIALGARPSDVSRSMMKGAVVLTLVGMATGLAGGVALGLLASSFFYGIKPYDPVTLASAAFLLLGVSAIAAWIPSRRAARTSPLTALRAE